MAIYVGVHGFRNGKPLPRWERIRQDGINEWVKSNPSLETYLNTIQVFDSDIQTDNEPHQSDLFFDIDSSELELALKDSITLSMYFKSYFDIEPKIWFSGSKGFHILIDHRYIGTVPNPILTKVYMYLADYFVSHLKLTTVDLGVYTTPRMWRIPNTINPKSGLYKIPLTINQLMTLTIDEIKVLAKTPMDFDEYEIEVNPQAKSELKELFNQSQNKLEDSLKLDLGFIKSDQLEFGKPVPPCVSHLFTNGGVLKLGFRNRTSMVLSAYLKDAGYGIELAKGEINRWVSTIDQKMTSMKDRKSMLNAAMMVLKTVYASDKYHFSCGSILACGVKSDLCNDCKSIGLEAEEIDFYGYANAENLGKYICVEADVIGKDKKELLVPKKVTGYCPFDPDKNVCLTCTMTDYFNVETSRNERTLTFNSKSKSIVDLVDSNAGHMNTVLAGLFGMAQKKCPLFKMDIEFRNAQIIHIATRLNYQHKVEKQPKRDVAMLLAHGIELNRSYRLYGRVYQNPRTRAATFVIDKTEPISTMLDTFNLKPEELDDLKVFQASSGDYKDIESKVAEIHGCFRDSFIFIFGRDDLILGTDMVFHSARWLNFQRQKLKGWLDILIIGDSAQGKSEVATKLMQYYQLGTYASGESSSRTGLLYTIQMIAKEEAWVVFGLLPRCNGYLVVVDEVHGMPADDFKQFTLVRSLGIVDVKRVAYGTAQAETRLISIANAKAGYSLSSYGYPVQAIAEVPAFTSLEDIRRFDYAIGVRAGDVLDETINTNVNDIEITNHPYTDELCRKLILWIWTRTPDQIIISDETERFALSFAQTMSSEYVPDIPLVEAADQRNKLIRLATAFAGRTYNSPDGVGLVVTPDHVVCAYNMLTRLYKSQGLDYYGFSDEKARLEISDDTVLELTAQMRSMPNCREVATFMLLQTFFSKTIIQQSTNIPKEAIDKIIMIMLNHRFIEQSRISNSFKKTPSGRAFLKRIVTEESVEGKKEDSF
jgi:hypothetical protein